MQLWKNLRDREILRLAIPNILSNLSVPLLGLADTLLMGRMPDASFLAAVALGGVVFNFIYWGFGFLRMSTVGLTAQAYGADRNHEGSERVLGQALSIAMAGGALILLFQGSIGNLAFSLLKGDPQTEELGRSYYAIRIWAAPATLAMYAIQGWFLGMQNARYPLFLTLIANGLNVIFNLIFVLGLGMAAEGVALGTVIAQYIGLFVALFLMLRKYRHYLDGFFQGLDLAQLGKYFAVSADIFVRTMCLLLVFAWFTNESAGLGDTVLAANTILLQMFYLMSYGVDGFAFAAESLTGRFIGEKKPEKLQEVLKRIFYWGMGLGLVFSLLFLLAAPIWTMIFTNIEEVRDAARPYFPWLAAVCISGAAAFLWDGIYIGATASKAMRNTMLLSTFLVFFPVWYFTQGIWSNHALWLAMVAFMLTRSVSLTALAKKEIILRAKASAGLQVVQSPSQNDDDSAGSENGGSDQKSA